MENKLALKSKLSMNVNMRSDEESAYLWFLVLSSVFTKHSTCYKALIKCFKIPKKKKKRFGVPSLLE